MQKRILTHLGVLVIAALTIQTATAATRQSGATKIDPNQLCGCEAHS
jgi:hypothetical protein